MGQRLGDGQRIHLPAYAFTGFEGRFQVVSGDFHSQGIGNGPTRLLLVFDPGRVRQRHPNLAPINQKLDVDGVGVARSDGDNQGLVDAMNRLASPAVEGGEVVEHALNNDIGAPIPRANPQVAGSARFENGNRFLSRKLTAQSSQLYLSFLRARFSIISRFSRPSS